MNRERVGLQLVDAKVISSDDLSQALDIQQGEGGRLGSILVRMGVLSESTLLEFLSQHYGVSTVELSTCSIDEGLRGMVPYEIVHQHLVLPVRKTTSRLSLAMADPTNTSLLDELRFRTGLHIIPMVATESDLRIAIASLYGQGQDASSSPGEMLSKVDGLELNSRGEGARFSPNSMAKPVGRILSSATGSNDQETFMVSQEKAAMSRVNLHVKIEKDSSAVDVVNHLVQQAIEMEASDIHIEPLEKMLRIRFRLDGVLRPIQNLPKDLHQPLLARLKILSNLDIAERRLPQDGRMKMEGFPHVDIRVAILPCLFGEKAVLRLLNQSGLALHLTNIGLDQPDLDRVTTALENPYGMILVTGPTGSGKTTTLYSALQFLNTPQMNIVTVEDPVEYQIQGINQLQIHEDIGLNFSTGLRAFLRQDPDVMMVGEIRDRETAQIAIQASLTGHRVLSTLHTMNAPGAITRLIDMSIEPFLVSSAISLIVGQRLVRKICEHCRELDTVSQLQLLELGFDGDTLDAVRAMKGRGCVYCHLTGFKGRMALFETLPIFEGLHDQILGRASTNELKIFAMREGFRTLRQAGLSAVQRGLTTVGEVFSETRSDTSA
ncbi:MAG: ATPase, T2SS/T4P/T4SS family [Nitrospirota bacterium]|nr:ATPase, T2SS/T4P/T4SS family [Nitrospirota bacterium]MDH4359955.1 ATPase, T2SS/T4P/T4SS family [Nitrospirota bacterium]MDH5574343.1 ATPase, T2SS/T4P/T4SS family [Nitrospirota bacterium]